MPDYKKRRRRRGIAPKVKPTSNKKRMDDFESDNEAAPSRKRKPAVSFNILKGNKPQNRRKSLIGLCIFVCLIVIAVIINMSYPAVIPNVYYNVSALIGNGSYPIDIKGTQTINSVSHGNYYYILTDTHISVFSNSGKEMFSAFHGFSKPVLATSSGGALVYDQGGNQLLVLSPKGQKAAVSTENEIITGAISDSGKFAVATYSDKYSAAVSVYNKRSKVIYEWYSAEDVINNLVISRNGKKIAVTTVNSKSGVLNSKLNVLNFKSATPEFSKSYDNTVVYGLGSGNDSVFNVIKENEIECIKWFSHNSLSITDDYSVAHFRDIGSRKIAVFTRENDSADNHIVVFSSRGKVKANIKYKGTLTDIKLRGRSVYCINDTTVTVMDFDGNILKSIDYGFGAVKLSLASADTVILISDTQISKTKLK